jgi:hypothetical protein
MTAKYDIAEDYYQMLIYVIADTFRMSKDGSIVG